MFASLIPMIVGQVIGELISSPAVPVDHTNASAAEVVVERAVRRELEPVIEHVTNQEPWYQSRVTLGAAASILSGVAGLAGFAIGADDLVTILTMVGPVLGGAFALYGRWKARKPLGA